MIDFVDYVIYVLFVIVVMCLYFIDGKMCVIFMVDLVQDLLGDWVFIQVWDGIEGCSVVCWVVVVGYEEGLWMLQKIVWYKECLGFWLVYFYYVG